ncbi:DinB family protein [Bacillus sp. N9]
MEALKLFKYSRTSTLIALSKIDEKKWDEQPAGYPNTVRWNAGHVYITAEDF